MFAKKMKMTSVAILMALSLTACGGAGNTDAQNTPAPTQPTASASVAPSETPSEKPMTSAEADEFIAKEIAKKSQTVASINIDEAFEKHGNANIEKVFPSKDFDTKAGVKFGLNFMQDLINTSNFYEERPEGDDWDILSSEDFTPRLSSVGLDGARKSIDANGFFSQIPSAHYTGVMPVEGGKTIKLEGAPADVYNTPAVFVDSSTDTDILYVQGEREMTFTSTKGEKFELSATYYIGMVPSGDSWKIENIGWSADTATLKAVK